MDYPGAGVPPEGVVPNMERPRDVLNTTNYVTQALTMLFVTAFFVFRVYSKIKLHGLSFTADDYATFAAYILMVAYCITACFAGYYGGGHDIWEVPKEDIQHFFQAGYAATIVYAPMALTVKLALVTLIIRVFGTVHKKTRIGLYVFVAMIVGYYGSGLFIKIFVCRPIPTYWTGPRDNCLDESAIIMADSVISVISDLVILLAPTPLTWSLQLPVRKRLRVIGILCAGGVATAFSVYRLGMILSEGHSPNSTIVFIKVILSGNAEIGIGLICACLPAVSAYFARRKRGTDYYGGPSRTGGLDDTLRGEIMMTRTFQVHTGPKSVSYDEDDGSKMGADDAVLISNIQANPQSRADSTRRSSSL